MTDIPCQTTRPRAFERHLDCRVHHPPQGPTSDTSLVVAWARGRTIAARRRDLRLDQASDGATPHPESTAGPPPTCSERSAPSASLRSRRPSPGGLALRYDGVPCFRSDHYQAEIDRLGIARCPRFSITHPTPPHPTPRTRRAPPIRTGAITRSPTKGPSNRVRRTGREPTRRRGSRRAAFREHGAERAQTCH